MTRVLRRHRCWALALGMLVGACSLGPEPARDAGRDGEPGDGAASVSPFAGTCAEALFACFDFRVPCSQMPAGTGTILFVSGSGARYEIDLTATGGAMGVATGSSGQTCFTSQADPEDKLTVTYLDPDQVPYRITSDPEADVQTVVCPDGTAAVVEGSSVPALSMLDQCAFP